MRIIEILITAEKQSGKTQGDIAREAGMTPTELSDKLAGRKPFTEQDIMDLAPVLQTHPSKLMGEVSRKELLDLVKGREKKLTQKIGKTNAAVEEEPAPTMLDARAERALHVVPVYPIDRRLKVIESVDESEDAVAIPVWRENIAATQIDNLHAIDEAERVWIPGDISKIHGARAWAVRIVGMSMMLAGIEPGDILIVRRSSTAKNEDIVIAAQDGGVTCARLRGEVLVKENEDKVRYPDIPLSEDNRLLGVAKAIYKSPRSQ